MKEGINIRKLTYKKVKEFVESLGYFIIDNEYINIRTKFTIKDNLNYYYYIKLDNIKQERKPRIVDKSNPYTIQNIKLWCKLNNKDFELISDTYEGCDINLKWKCFKKECGEIFESTWDNIKANRDCPFCAGKRVGLSNCLATTNPELAKEWHPTLNGDLTPFNVTPGTNKNIWWQCEKGHEWQAEIYNRAGNNSGCPYCSGRYASEDYNLLKDNPELCKEWDYNKNDKNPEDYTPYANQYVWWVCKECDYEWKINIYSRNRKDGKSCGCPSCSESKGEKRCKEILTIINIPHDRQYTFDNLRGIGGGLLRYDIPVFWDEEKTKLRMLIEYDGEFHFKKFYEDDGFETLQIHDKMKDEYCKNNNIPLLRIPYWDYDKIEEIVRKTLIK